MPGYLLQYYTPSTAPLIINIKAEVEFSLQNYTVRQISHQHMTNMAAFWGLTNPKPRTSMREHNFLCVHLLLNHETHLNSPESTNLTNTLPTYPHLSTSKCHG